MSRIRRPPDELQMISSCHLVRPYISCGVYDPTDDPRLQQDMESELAADVEWYDHPTKGRIRLVDELVHAPGTLPLTSDSGVDDTDDWDPR